MAADNGTYSAEKRCLKPAEGCWFSPSLDEDDRAGLLLLGVQWFVQNQGL